MRQSLRYGTLFPIMGLLLQYVRSIGIHPDMHVGLEARHSLQTSEQRPVAGIHHEWEYRVNSSRQIPLFEKELRALLEQIGFEIVSSWSDYSGAPFDAHESNDLLLMSRRPR